MSESEEMYLVTIARLNESGDNLPVPVSQLAAELNVLPVSANQMIRKLEETGWVCYTPYKGVSLTEEGAALALQILRHRRLWEVFLVEKLKIPVAEAAELACRLEHFLPVDAAERLAIYLGNPGISPTGSPIPQPGKHQPLANAKGEIEAQITQVVYEWERGVFDGWRNRTLGVRAVLIAA